MKKNILAIIISAPIFLSGCYTVIWMPEDQFPSENTANEYYDETYYGDYYTFYDYPWWLRLAPPSTSIGNDYMRNENGTTSSIRNEGNGRGTDNGRTILPTNPPSRSGSNNNSSNNNTNGSSNDNSSTTNSNNNNSNDRNSNNSSIRNNDGNRNSNSGRK